MSHVAIIVPVHNRASLARQSLRVLLGGATDGLAPEVIVVDDGSLDETPRLLADFGDRVQVLRLRQHDGYAAACDAAVAATTADHLVVLDTDVLPRRGWLSALVRYAEQHPKAGVVGSKLVSPDNHVFDGGILLGQSRKPRSYFRGLPADDPAVNRSGPIRMVNGHCMLVRRQALRDVEGFDSGLGDVFPDADLCLRMQARGYEVHYCHESKVVHLDRLCRRPRPEEDVDLLRVHRQRWLPRLVPDDPSAWQIQIPAASNGSDQGDLPPGQTPALTDRRGEPADHEVGPAGSSHGPPGAARPALPGPSLGLSDSDFRYNREAIAATYLRGEGIEIGALHQPLPVPPWVTVRYVDRMSSEALRAAYPSLDPEEFSPVDIVADGERLETIGDGTQDFVIANHFLEHCQDPILALRNMVRVLRPGGVLYLSVPDKRYTFDVDRPVTPLEHVVRDHEEGPAWSRREHFDEWARLVAKLEGEEEIKRHVDQLLALDYSIHYHVWTQWELLELLAHVRTREQWPVDLELLHKNLIEVVAVFRRLA